MCRAVTQPRGATPGEGIVATNGRLGARATGWDRLRAIAGWGAGLLLLAALVAVAGAAGRANAAGGASGDAAVGAVAERAAGTLPLHSPELCARFYRERGFRLAWTEDSRLLPAAEALKSAIRRAAGHGLRPDDYLPPEGWRSDEEEGGPGFLDAPSQAVRDLLLTDAFLTLADHLRGGRAEPGTTPPSADLTAVLEEALSTGRIAETLEGLAPSDAGYRGLRGALAWYRAVAAAGGWEPLPETAALRRGDLSPATALLRQRLFAEGFLAAPEGPPGMDADLEAAVRAFQDRYGLETDGVVGRATRRALNVPVETRVAQVEANLERLRWRGQLPAARHLRVNTAAFRLEAWEQGNPVLQMPVVVGATQNPTPVFTGRMTHLVLNPSWNVPPRIAREDLLPQLRKDPLRLEEKGFQVLRGWDAPQVVDPTTVDWAAVSLQREGLHFRQRPGPENAMGQVKFLFPNRFHVYLHDTPSRDLFSRARRDFSRGCIRVAEPVRLAEYVLAGDPRWPPEALTDVLAQGLERTVYLREPVSVHIEYFTAWVGKDGAVHFRTDLYGHDRELVARLQRDTAPDGSLARLAALDLAGH
ncbi:MAG: L,D-transpeptidase family protein [Deferrisomatales bacterium]|nr:L,D-transpeptidase family protein [Deferrisomatales bacterium]